jgi:hypothetical protein
MLSNALSFRLTPSFVVLSIPQQWLEVEGQAEGSSLTQTVFNGVNAMAGLALLVLPSVMVDVGWLFAPLMVAICAMSLYTISLLEACQVWIDQGWNGKFC